jgi:ABC-type multidrug transport system ATPase subunit
MSPKLLILDEPTRGIDVGAKEEIQALIGQLAAEGLGVLMISSEIEEIVEGSDRVFVMREGRTVAELDDAAITEDAFMAAMAETTEASYADGGSNQTRDHAAPSVSDAGPSTEEHRSAASLIRQRTSNRYRRWLRQQSQILRSCFPTK